MAASNFELIFFFFSFFGRFIFVVVPFIHLRALFRIIGNLASEFNCIRSLKGFSLQLDPCDSITFLFYPCFSRSLAHSFSFTHSHRRTIITSMLPLFARTLYSSTYSIPFARCHSMILDATLSLSRSHTPNYIWKLVQHWILFDVLVGSLGVALQ